jgi:cytochrome P450
MTCSKNDPTYTLTDPGFPCCVESEYLEMSVPIQVQRLMAVSNYRMKYDENLSIMPYSPMWRKQRREFHSHFNQSVVDVYHPVILDERAHLLKDLLAHPSEYSKHTKT